ncbi:MAG: hypothetical protein ACOC78_03065 [Actinomycetota bacterium]
MDKELHPIDFVDYHAVFSEALTRLGRGLSVSEAVESCLREIYPLTYKDINQETRHILAFLKEAKGWGSVRALRELADKPDLAEEIRACQDRAETKRDTEGTSPPDTVAEYPRIFALAQRKRQSGYSLEDSLDMAVRELYPQTFRKIKEAALFYVRLGAHRRGIHQLRALRELAEDPLFFSEIDRSQQE